MLGCWDAINGKRAYGESTRQDEWELKYRLYMYKTMVEWDEKIKRDTYGKLCLKLIIRPSGLGSVKL